MAVNLFTPKGQTHQKTHSLAAGFVCSLGMAWRNPTKGSLHPAQEQAEMEPFYLPGMHPGL